MRRGLLGFFARAGSVEAVAAEGLVDVFLAEEDEVVALAEAVRVVRERAAADANGMHLLHVLGDGHQARHGPEGLAEVVGVEAGHDDAHAAVGEGLADFDEGLVEELRLVDADDLHLGGDFVEHLGGGADWGGGDFMEIVRDHLDVGVAFVDDGFEDGDLLVGELGAAQAADQFFGLAGEHGTADDLDAAGFFVILGKHCLNLWLHKDSNFAADAYGRKRNFVHRADAGRQPRGYELQGRPGAAGGRFDPRGGHADKCRTAAAFRDRRQEAALASQVQ